MKYILYTIFIFVICLLQASFLSAFSLGRTSFDLLFILLFAYYVSRKNSIGLYLFFMGGIFLDLLRVTQVGVTSANFFLSLLAFLGLSTIFPAERAGKAIAITGSSLVYAAASYLTFNFIAGNGIQGILFVIPWAVVNAILIFILSGMLDVLKPVKREAKLKIS